MSTIEKNHSNWDSFKADKRESCKYGATCYQKNPAHIKRFKHPPKDDEPTKDDTETTALAEDNDQKNDDSIDEPQPKKARRSSEGGNGVINVVETIPESPEDNKEKLKAKFLVHMPDDFYKFWEFCSQQCPSNPEEALLSTCGLRLVGPFDVVAGRFSKRKKSEYLTHWRFYYDPPEFQTLLIKPNDEEGFHMGYFRDDPNEDPVFVASNRAEVDCRIKVEAPNLFAAVFNYIDELIKSADPFKKTLLNTVKGNIKEYGVDAGFTMKPGSPAIDARRKKSLAATFHGAGMVVPYDKKTEVGYREIPETTKSLKRIFRNIVECEDDSKKDDFFDVLQELVTNVQFANDEGDPGMGLELGIDAFCYGGKDLHSTIAHLLGVAYQLLNRQAFGDIVKAHLKIRQKGKVPKME